VARPAGEWAGRDAFIIGGGASLSGVDVEQIRGRGHVIAVNDAGLDLAPWADILFFADGWPRWFSWNYRRLPEFKGGLIVTRAKVPQVDDRIRLLRHDPAAALSQDPQRLAGYCGGASAINLAYLMGARRIVLLGFDMQGGNWHDNHRAPPLENAFARHFIPSLNRMAVELAAAGCEVFNANRDSALKCFPFCDLEDLPHG